MRIRWNRLFIILNLQASQQLLLLIIINLPFFHLRKLNFLLNITTHIDMCSDDMGKNVSSFIYLLVGTFATCLQEDRKSFRKQTLNKFKGKLMFEHPNKLQLVVDWPAHNSSLGVSSCWLNFVLLSSALVFFIVVVSLQGKRRKVSNTRTRSGISEIENSSFVWRNKTFVFSSAVVEFSLQEKRKIGLDQTNGPKRRGENQT